MLSASVPVVLPEQHVPSRSPVIRFFNQLQPTPETIILMSAVVIGIGAGVGVLLFRSLIGIIHHWMFEELMGQIYQLGAWTLACVPTLGGVLVALIRWVLKDLGGGISSLISAVQSGKEFSPLKPVMKAIAAAISLGSGASLGPEGPSVEIGANFGILLGQFFKVSEERQQLLLGAGAAAGLAAGFNAPIAGVFFALEVVLGSTFQTSKASVVVLSAVVAGLVAQMGMGAQPAFNLPVYEVRSPLELPLYLGLGLCACVVSIAYTNLLQWMKSFFQGEVPYFTWMTKIPTELHPILGGLCVGIVALVLPQVLGVGYGTVEAVLRDVKFPLVLLIALLGAKLLLTAISLGSGLVGGIFAPAMFLGAALGAAYGEVLPHLFPMFANNIAAPPAYAMVGMAAVLASTVRAPLTATLLLFEMTRDYRIVLPLMAAVGLSVWLVEPLRTQPIKLQTERRDSSDSVEEKPAVDPLELRAADRKQEILKTIAVSEAMDLDFLELPDSLPVLDAGLELIQHQRHSALVMTDEDELIGIITVHDINRAIARWEKLDASTVMAYTLGDVCTTEILYAYTDERLSDAVERMSTRGLHQLPVLDRDDPHQIIGLLHQEGIALACDLELTHANLIPYLSQPEPEPELLTVAASPDAREHHE